MTVSPYPQIPTQQSFDQIKATPSQAWVRWFQDLVNVAARFVTNRVTASTSATAVNLNGTPQSTGIGTAAITPKFYGEFQVNARASFNISAAGALRLYVYRTTGAVPANGSAPNAGDVIVGGDAFAGPATAAGVNVSGSMSFIDSGLTQTQAYRYYFAVVGTNALVGNLVNSSQLQVSEI